MSNAAIHKLLLMKLAENILELCFIQTWTSIDTAYGMYETMHDLGRDLGEVLVALFNL
jgi:hypothetical protein